MMDGWLAFLRPFQYVNRISVISRRWADDNERLCAKLMRPVHDRKDLRPRQG